MAKYICLVKDVFQSSLNHDKSSLDVLNKMHNYFPCECVHIKCILFNDGMRYPQYDLNSTCHLWLVSIISEVKCIFGCCFMTLVVSNASPVIWDFPCSLVSALHALFSQEGRCNMRWLLRFSLRWSTSFCFFLACYVTRCSFSVFGAHQDALVFTL